MRLRWRTMMLMIAGHLDSKVPLTRILCVTLDQLPAVVLATSALPLGSGQMQHRGVVMDIETIKWCHPEHIRTGKRAGVRRQVITRATEAPTDDLCAVRGDGQ